MTSTRTTTDPGTDAWAYGCAAAWPGVWVDTDTGARTAVDGHVEAASGGWADAHTDAAAEAEAWASADAVPSAEQLAGLFAHPSAALDDTDVGRLMAASAPGFGRIRVRMVAVSYQVTARLKRVSDPRCGMVT